MSFLARVLLCLLLWPALLRPAAADTAAYVSDHDVHVVRVGSHFTVDMVAFAPVAAERAWAVLTDFEHMADFMPNLRSSEVLERNGSVIKVRQAGEARYGIFSSRFDFVREFTLSPRVDIRAYSTGGNIRRMDSLMHLEPEAAGTRLQYHAEVEPDFWLPPVLGPSFVRHETAEQFSAMIREMVRRH
ncbi:MAG: SRPBCC family protein [Thauera sp.]|nr:SRPBCC family protein [Thauera sp.]